MNIDEYFDQFKTLDEFSLTSNKEYFESLWQKYQNPENKDIQIHQPEAGIESNIIPAALLSEKELPITHYQNLSSAADKLQNYQLVLCKMHAGIGSSVKRRDYLKKITGREQLGSKGTDLFISLDGENKSLAQLQYQQAKILADSNTFNEVYIQNLINEETINEISKLDNLGVKERPQILQLKVPTLLDGELTSERVAPAGHAYLGFALLSKIFKNELTQDLYVIGNGEDLNSTADPKILSWVVENNIPITMITTTKLEKDKKGGQISLVRHDKKDYVTIIEKAQAESAHQLEYFEKLGLRPQDNPSLFNTNIVVINAEAMKAKLSKLSLNFSDFKKVITPDLIQNVKKQQGQDFVQL